MFDQVSKKISAWHRSSYVTYAQRTGAYKWATSGGQCILPRRHLRTMLLDEDLVAAAVGTDGGGEGARSRWTACCLRTKSVTILFVTVYLLTSQELSEFNLSVLHQVFLLIAHFSGPAVISGDWQMPPSVLAANPWISKLNLQIVAPTDTEFTCSVGPKRMLDYFIASREIAEHMSLCSDFLVPWEIVICKAAIIEHG